MAGGIGIAPLLFLAQSMDPSHYRFLAGFATARDIVRPEDVLGDMAEVSLATDDGSEGYGGPVTDLLGAYLKEHGADGGSPSLFTCGPHPMLEAVAKLAREYQLPCQVSLEEFMACAVGGCAGCTVEVQTEKGAAMKRVVLKPLSDSKSGGS